MSFAFSFRPISIALLAAWGCGVVSAQQPSQRDVAAARAEQGATAASAPLQFRRLYVPQKNVAERFGEYMPMKRERFEKLLESLSRRKELKNESLSPRLQVAEYSARLDDTQLVDGAARWSITYEHDAPARLRLWPLRLAVEQVAWSDQESPAALAGNTQSGGFVVDVARSGDLLCDWSLQGEIGQRGEIEFDIRVPACPISRMTLLLPHGAVPTADDAWIEPLANDDTADDDTADDDTTNAGKHSLKKWLIVFGGRSRITLRITSKNTLGEMRKPLWRQRDSYRFDQRGLELTSDIEIDLAEALGNRLEFELDESLQVAEVSLEARKVAWRVASDVAGRQRITLDLDEELKGASRTVRIRALAPLRFDAAWELPSIRLKGGAWSEGSATLLIPRGLALADLQLRECRQSQVRPLPAIAGGDIFEIRRLNDDSAIAVRLTPLPSRLTMQSGVTLEIDAASMSAAFVAEVATQQGETFELLADAPRRWEIDSLDVFAEDAQGLADILHSWEITTGRQRTQVLKIRLNKSLNPGNPIQLMVQAHRRRTESRRVISADDVFRLSIHEAHSTLNLVAVEAKPPLLVRLDGGADTQRLDPDALPDSYADLISPVSGKLLFRYGPHAGRYRLTTIKREPRFTTEIRMETLLRDGRLTESYEIQCSPETPMSRLLVDFTRARSAPLRWSLDSEPEALLSSRLLTTAAPGISRETWELTFRSPRSDRFRVRAVRDISASDAVDLSLASLPESLSQTGALAVVAAVSEHWRLESVGLAPIPVSTVGDENLALVRSEFRYRPSQQAGLHARRTETQQPSAWIWRANMTSKLTPSGAANHVLELHVENSGDDAISIELPVEVRFLSAQIDGKTISVALPHTSPPRLRLPLDRETRFSQIRLSFATRTPPWRTETQIGMPQVVFDAPVLARRWSVWLPPSHQGYVISETPKGSPASWLRRLLGPFLKPSVQPRVEIEHPKKPLVLLGHSTRGPAGEAPPWRDRAGASTANSGETGWQILEIPLRRGQQPGLQVFNTTQISLIACGCFLLFSLFFYALLAWRLDFLAPLAGLTAIAAILTPPGYAPLATASFLAVIASGAACVLRTKSGAAPGQTQLEVRRGGGGSTTMTHVGLSVVLLAALTHGFLYAEGAISRASAQDAAAQDAQQPPRNGPPNQAAREIFPVVFPVDEEGEQAGDYVRLPRTFYDRIHRAAAAVTFKTSESVIAAAQYTLGFHAAGNTLEVAGLAASFNIRAVELSGDFSLPLRRDDLDLLADSVRIDGISTSFEWSADEHALLVHGVAPGDHTLEFEFLPRVVANERRSGFEVRIPRVSQATLQMTYPTGRSAPTCLSALGAEVFRPEEGQTSVPLGPTDQLRIEWGDATPADNPTRGVSVEALLWLRVKPGSVVLDGQFRFSSAESLLSEIALYADPRLKRLRIEAAPAATLKETNEVGENTFALSFTPGEKSKQALVQASFLLARSEGVGVLRTPRVGGVAEQVTRRWLAVSVDPLLEYEFDAMAELERVVASDFTDRWNEADAAPDFVVSLDANDQQDWGLRIQPRAVSARASQTLTVSYGALQDELQQHTKLLLRVSVSPSGGGFFQHRVKLPQDVKVRSVSVLENGQEQLLHWSQNAGELAIFLASKLDQPHQIIVQAEQPSSRIGKTALPRFEMEACDVESEQIRIYRRPGVNVELLEAPGYAAVEQDELQSFLAGSGRLAASLMRAGAAPRDATPKQAPILLRVSLNRPRVRSWLLTGMRRREDGWEAALDGRVEVVGRGVIDEVRLETPDDWPEQIEIQPAMPYEVVKIPGRNRRELVLRPKQAIDDEFTFSITSKLTVSPGEGIRSPDVQFLNVQEPERYLAAPLQVQQQLVSWRVRGLRPAPLPDIFPGRYADRDEWKTYQVVAPGFSAMLERVEQFVGDPLVRLADAKIVWDANASYHGVVGFDLEPSGLANCEVVAPAGVRLVSVRIGGAAAVVDSHIPNRWRVHLQSTILPQHLEVVFQGTAQAPTSRGAPWRITAPELAAIPVERSLGTLIARSTLADRIATDSAVADPTRQNVFRLRALAFLLDLPTDVAANLTESELESWGEGFLYRLENCQAALVRQAAAKNAEVDPQELATLLEGIAKNTNRIGLLASPFVQREHPWRGLTTSAADGVVVRRTVHRGGENVVLVRLKESNSVDTPSVFWRWRLPGLRRSSICGGCVARRRAPVRRIFWSRGRPPSACSGESPGIFG